MTINRDNLLNRLIVAKSHNLIKILTGIRRCGKSYLLFNLFKQHLIDTGTPRDHIVEIDLESDDFLFCRDAITLGKEIRARLPSDNAPCFVLIDEIQHAMPVLPEGTDLSRIKPEDRNRAYITFYHVLNGLLKRNNINTYVTGSNAKLLSSEVATEFRGRSEVIEVTPLSFAEVYPLMAGTCEFGEMLENYFTFGGLPECVLLPTEAEKRAYLANLIETIYLRDVAERHALKSDVLLSVLTDTVMSNICGLTNPTKIANTVKTEFRLPANHVTVAKYLNYLEDAFLIRRARRFDIKGNRYLASPSKYYATDTGIRNAKIAFRQNEMSHLMENAIYIELVRRGYSVDVGMVTTNPVRNGMQTRVISEVDFVINKASERIYIQSAMAIPDAAKREQETYSLNHIRDSFRKIVITGNPHEKPRMDANGIVFMGIKTFLLDPTAIESI
ncbi:MAG: ATP-binding protein [Kiritimatiellia bacterium]